MFDLSEDALAHMQADIDAVGQLFAATVARNRGLAIKDVTRTQAGTFLGGKGVDIGFADAVAAPDEAFRALLKQLDNPGRAARARLPGIAPTGVISRPQAASRPARAESRI